MTKAGTKLTCANGHPYATVLEDIEVGELNWVRKLKFGAFNPDGMVDPRCPECGARLFTPENKMHSDHGPQPS